MRPDDYGLPATALEAPIELVRVTVSAATGPTDIGPEETWKVNGTVTVNSLPKASEALLLYQLTNGVPSGTVTSVVARFVPVVGVKWNCALTMSRGVE